MSRNKVIFDVLADSSQYKAQMQGIEKSTTQTSKAITAAFAVSSAALVGSLTAFAKYETQLIKVGKTADISGKELNDFGKDVVALSAKIPLSTNELLELAASAAQLGVKGKDNILKFTETIAKLGTATNITGEQGAQDIARLLNVTGEGIGTVDKFASIIVRLGNNVAATESEILSMASRVGKATAQFDIGTTAVLGISAALKEVGIEAELGGSAVGRTFMEIQSAVFKGGAALDTFSAISGKSGAELKQIWQEDSTKAFQILIESLNKLPADQVATAMGNMGLEGVRLQEVIGTLAKRSELLGRSLAMASDEAQKQTALDEEFNRAVVSLENSFKFMKDEVINLASSLGKDLAPEVKALIDDITSMIRGIRQFNEATGGAITTSVVMAAKVAGLVIAVNKLKAILISTGVISSVMAAQMGGATLATTRLSIASSIASIQSKGLAGSMVAVATASKTALLAIKNFQVGLTAMIGGLIIAVDLGRKLGNVIGKLNEVNTSEKELANTQKDLNKLMAERAKLQEKVNAGDSGAQEKLDNINKEISQREGLIKVLEREVAARAGGGSTSPTDAPEMGGAASPVDTGLPVDNKEAQKTAILEENISARLAAAQREAELYSQIEMLE
jgi:TP901 family phage tail tape measure protein